MTFDLFIIGGGPAGYTAAERAADSGLHVALAEEDALGGVCLNSGCIPSKNLLHAAKLYDAAKGSSAPFGVRSESATVDLGEIVERKNQVVQVLKNGIEQMLTGKKVTLFHEKAVIQGRDETSGLFQVLVGEEAVTAERLLIATGSDAAVPPIPGLKEAMESGVAVTNRAMLDLKDIPPRLAVIGGGVIGLEMAVAFRALGSDVTIIEMLDKIAGPVDKDISKRLQMECKKAGITIHLNAAVTAVDGNTLTWEDRKKKSLTETFDYVLVCTGRRPRTRGIGLETLNIALERGAVVTDEKMRTNVPNVYAAGDVNGRSMLAHTAHREAEVAVNTMLGVEDAVDYHVIPSVIYTFPSEVAAIGLTEAEAEKEGVAFETVTMPLSFSGRYLAENERGRGLVKAVFDSGKEHLLGFTMYGTPASEIISTLAVAMTENISVDCLKRVVFPHPTVGEIIHALLYR